MPNNHDQKLMTAEEIRERIAEIEKELHKITSSGSASAWGALAGVGVAAFIPVIGGLIGAAATATGAGIAASFIKKKRELQKELKKSKHKLEIMEVDGSSNNRVQRTAGPADG